MNRVGAACVIALLITVAGAPRAAASATFSSSVVASSTGAAEPKVFVDDHTRPPTIYIAAPDGPTHLWRSTDGGRTFDEMTTTDGGGGDADVAVDARGTLYVADLFNAAGNPGFPISTSFDRGLSYARMVDAAQNQSSLDREWIASNAAGHVVGTATDNAGSILAWVSDDYAQTFDGPFTVAKNTSIQGPIVTGPGRVYYTIYGSGGSLFYARSRNGANWNSGRIAAASVPVLFPVIAVDKASNLFAAWTGSTSEVSGGRVYFAKSTNGGRTWSAPAALSPSGPSTIFPWIVATGKGKVAVTYALARTTLLPDLGNDLGGAQTSWDYVLTETTDALASRPKWTSTFVVRGFHTGSICAQGTGCPFEFGLLNVPVPFDRRDLDFAGAGVDAAGNVYLSYNRDRSPLSGNPNDVIDSATDLVLARQIGGPRLR